MSSPYGDSQLPYNRPLKIRGQALPPGSAGVMIFLHFRLLFFSHTHPFSLISPTSSHHRAPDLCSERAVRQKTSCLSRQLTESYLSFSEHAATSSQLTQIFELVLETTTVDKLPVVLRPSYADAKLERMGLCSKICHFLNILNILT